MYAKSAATDLSRAANNSRWREDCSFVPQPSFFTQFFRMGGGLKKKIEGKKKKKLGRPKIGVYSIVVVKLYEGIL